jgi:hypothetical protein
MAASKQVVGNPTRLVLAVRSPMARENKSPTPYSFRRRS